MGDRSRKKEASNRGILGFVCDILSLILGKEKVEEKYSHLKEEEGTRQDSRKDIDSVMETIRTSFQEVSKLEKEAERKVKESRFKYENTFLDKIFMSAHVISQCLRSICEKSDFQDPKIKQKLQDIQKIELVDILSSEENIEEFFKKNINDVIKNEKGATYRWIIQKFWDKYSKVFILKQRIDNYQLKRESPSESKELLQKLSGFLDLIGTMVQELFQPMGITPTPVSLFDEFDSDKHSEENVSEIKDDREFRSFLWAKIREENGVGDLIVDILSWGYESKLEGLESKKPQVVYYHDTESNRRQWFR